MLVYRITLAKWSHELYASGYSGRWNSKDVKVIYSAGSRALACLENIVHRSGEGLNNVFRTLVIEIPPKIKIVKVDLKNLPDGWDEINAQSITKTIGDEWIKKGKAPILKVPSAIIKQEFNYLFNPEHKDFKKIKLLKTEAFDFDMRLKD